MTGSGPISDEAPRWVTTDKDGHLPATVTRWLATPPEEVAFPVAVLEWSTTHGLARIPSVTLVNDAGKQIFAELDLTPTTATARFSEPLAGKMLLA